MASKKAILAAMQESGWVQIRVSKKDDKDNYPCEVTYGGISAAKKDGELVPFVFPRGKWCDCPKLVADYLCGMDCSYHVEMRKPVKKKAKKAE